MNNDDEILLEQYFPYKNMTIEERNYCINLILHTKDVDESEVSLNKNSYCNFDLLFLHLSKESNYIRFDGATYNDDENRMIYGDIVRVGNKIFIKTNVYRCNDVLYDNNEYSVVDEFVFKNGKILRKTRYNSSYHEAEIELYDDSEMEDYIERKCRQIKLKR